MSALALKHLENCFSQPANLRTSTTQMPRFRCELSAEDIASLRSSAVAAWLLPTDGEIY
jgi:hypothetical protein